MELRELINQLTRLEQRTGPAVQVIAHYEGDLSVGIPEGMFDLTHVRHWGCDAPCDTPAVAVIELAD